VCVWYCIGANACVPYCAYRTVPTTPENYSRLRRIKRLCQLGDGDIGCDFAGPDPHEFEPCMDNPAHPGQRIWFVVCSDHTLKVRSWLPAMGAAVPGRAGACQAHTMLALPRLSSDWFGLHMSPAPKGSACSAETGLDRRRSHLHGMQLWQCGSGISKTPCVAEPTCDGTASSVTASQICACMWRLQ